MNFQGWVKTPPKELMWFEKLLGQTQGSPLFGDLYQGDKDAGKGVVSAPYKSVMKFFPTAFGDEKQTTGDCFIPNTEVYLGPGKGRKFIRSMVVGDVVYTPHGNYRRVTNVINKPYYGDLVTLMYGEGYSVTATPDHRMMLETGPLVPVSDLRSNDRVVCLINGERSSREVTSLSTTFKQKTPVHCIEVEQDHVFYADGVGVSNCTSHGTRNGIDITRAVDIDIKGEPEEWVARGATEYIYGMRGHSGQGMNVTRACRFVHEKGFLVRGKYGTYNLSKYNASLGMAWGRSQTPRSLQEEASKHPLQYFAQISSGNAETEIRNALANGYGIVFGGNGGWSSRRDANGIAEGIGSASWSHCMSLGAYDDRCVAYDEPLVLVLQSWGRWLDGGHGDLGPLPVGSAWIPLSWFIKTYVQRGETICIGNAQGYPAKSLPDYGFGDYLG